MTPFVEFDRIRIINLISRPDRRREMEAELQRIGLDSDPRVEFAEGVVADDMGPFRTRGEMGLFLANLNILREAAKARESVLILEDDADFTPAARDFKVPPGTDIFYGGYYPANPTNLQNSDIIGSHCMGFSARAVQALVPFLEGLLKHESPPPMDGAFVWFRRQVSGFVTSFAVPAIANQRPSRSDIAAPSRLDRIALLRGPMTVARGIKRRVVRGEITFGLPEAIIVCVILTGIGIAAAWYYTRG